MRKTAARHKVIRKTSKGVSTYMRGKGNAVISGTNIKSSFIKDFSYNMHKHELCVVIGESAYLYQGVPERVFVNFRNSKSAGSFFATKIKDKYKAEKKSIYGT